MKTSRLNPKKIIAKHRQQTMEYYEGWVNAEKEKELKRKLFRFSVNRLVDVSKKKRTPKVITKEVPVEITKEVPVEIIKEVFTEVPVEKIVEKKVIDHEALAELQKEVRNLKHSQEAMERRYQTSLNDLREGKELQLSRFADLEEKQLKRYKRIVTYAYIITLYGLPQILGMILFCIK